MVETAMGQTTVYGEELREAVAAACPISNETTRAFPRASSTASCASPARWRSPTRSWSRACRESRSEIKTLQDDLNAVRTESLTDPLTSLSNRKAFDAALASAIATARDRHEPLTLLITDIDHFKRFNDSYGHLTGDQVLRLVASSVKQNVKGADLAARFGGEEFARDPAEHAAARRPDRRRAHPPRRDVEGARQALDRREPRPHHDLDRCRRLPPGRHRRRRLIERADACLYAAKRGGRNRVVCETDPEFDVQAERRLSGGTVAGLRP